MTQTTEQVREVVSIKLLNRLPRFTYRRLMVIFSSICLVLILFLCLLDTYQHEISHGKAQRISLNWRLRGESRQPTTRSHQEEFKNTYIKHQYEDWLHSQKQSSNESFDLRPDSSFMQQQAVVQRKRKRTLQDVCRKHPQLTDVQLTSRNTRLLFATDKTRLLYCAVPKAGCTNWKKVLMVLEGHQKHVWNITGYEAHQHNHIRNLSSMRPRDREYILETYPKFMYVRDPFVRLISAYRNKIARDISHQGKVFRGYARRIVSKYRKGALLHELEAEGNYNVTWDEWISYLTDPSELNGFNQHWMEFYKLCFPCRIYYDFIGNLETASTDSAYMLAVLGLDRVSYPSSVATGSKVFYDQYFANISKENLSKLWKIYKLDFKLFGFSRPSVLDTLDISDHM
ncbi:carbohydrate sulfotransferase 13-like isoform X2 [Acanthaster planci]|uniref:Carbohydrate sulfotransferase n=1 Tax=Acanthaster planci TaxID=133434 RepID=A0A8B7ZD23_ACAPL|nr:carbohydrate sulfotransferase 13-like isoform X2 [Acanthaster planci]